MSFSSSGWSGNPSRKRLWEETERARETRNTYYGSVAGIRKRLRENHKRRLAHGTRTP